MIDFDILLFFAEKHQQQKQTAVFLQAALYADHFGISLNVQNMSGVERLPWKKHVFFFYPLPFLISFPAVSMATKSLSVGSLCADVVTSIKPLSPSSVSLSVKLPSPPCDKLLTVNLTQHSLIQTTGSFFTP